MKKHTYRFAFWVIIFFIVSLGILYINGLKGSLGFLLIGIWISFGAVILEIILLVNTLKTAKEKAAGRPLKSFKELPDGTYIVNDVYASGLIYQRIIVVMGEKGNFVDILILDDLPLNVKPRDKFVIYNGEPGLFTKRKN